MQKSELSKTRIGQAPNSPNKAKSLGGEKVQKTTMNLPEGRSKVLKINIFHFKPT